MRHKKTIDRNSPRNRRRSGSAAFLEMALMIMPTFAIVGGFIDVGMSLFIWNTLQNAVREGTRYAITYQTETSKCQVVSVKDRVSQWSLGLVTASAVSNAGSTPWIEVNFYTQPTAANPNGTSTTANNPGNIVEVAVKNYPYSMLAPFSGSLSSFTAIAFYQAPGTAFTIRVFSADVLQTAPSGGVPCA